MSIYEELVEPIRPDIVCMADVEPEEVDFLWRPYIPANKITSLQGDPGGGKTMFSLYLAACLSSGRPFPGEEKGRPPATILYQTAEDGIADTIRPRLAKMGANMTNIHYINDKLDPLTLTDDRLSRAMEIFRPALLIIDPLQAFLGAGVDMHRANQVRPVLSRLAHLAETNNCAVLMVMHLNKGESKALYRGLGSIDFNGAVRSVLILGRNPQKPDQKILAHAKHNLSAQGNSIAFHIDGRIGIAHDGFSDLDADQVLAPARKKDASKVKEAIRFLKSFLGESCSAELSEIQEAAEKAGIAKRTLDRAKAELGLKTLTKGFHPKTTYWKYPDEGDTTDEEK